MKTVSLKLLPAALCAAGIILQSNAYAAAAVSDTLTGTVTDVTGTTSTSGSFINQQSTNQQLTLGLNWISSGYTGNLALSSMNATAAAGNSPNWQTNSVPNLNGSASITYTTVITNSTGAAANFNFDLNLNNSGLLVVPQYAYSTGSGTATSEISANVSLNNSSIWSSSATLSTASNYGQTTGSNVPVYSFSTTGDGFLNSTVNNVHPGSGPYNGTDYEGVTFGNTSLNIALGILNPGQSETLTYTLSSSASISDLANGGFVGYGGAVANVGDPFSTDSRGFEVQSSPVTPVPEAETVAMMAPGLLMVGVMARRKKKAKAKA